MDALISAVELIYRNLRKPVPAKPEPVTETPQLHITSEDVNKILSHERSATPEELQFIIDHAKQFGLSVFQRDRLGVDMTITMSAKMREAQGVKEDPLSLLLRSMGVLETPAGLLYNVERFVSQLRAGTKAIMECRDHRPPSCACWRSQRDWLYEVRVNHGEGSPECYAALRVWNKLEEIELTARRSG